MEDILVSINCITYNHENYIADALESFLKQETNFKFEILIHDDASTDRTVEIIRTYEQRYPDIIKPIYQQENQYSKGNLPFIFNGERAKGKYFAICEGDDYWTDPYKLQKQLAYMEQHPECSLCVHGGHVVNAADKKITAYNRPNNGNKIFTTEEIIEGGGGLFVTNSMFFPAKFMKELPNFFYRSAVSDYPLVIYLSLLGKVYYIDEYMSAYRTGVSESWTVKNYSTVTKKMAHFKEIGFLLDEINDYTNFKYDAAITRKKEHDQFLLLLEQKKFKKIKKEYKKLYVELGSKRKLIIFFDQYFSTLSMLVRGTKRKLMR